jgi:hypothetical protein
MNTQDEIQLSDDLRRIVASQPFSPDVAAIERRGRRERRRSLVVRGLAGVTVAGLAAAGGLTVSAHLGTSRGVASQATTGTTAGNPAVGKLAGQAGGPARTETVAYVQRQIAATALTLNHYLVKSRQNTSTVGSPSAEITIWTDPRTGNTLLLQGHGAGRLTYWEHDYFDSRRVLHWDQTQVNYGPRTWWTYNEHAAGPIQGPVPPGPAGGDYNTPAQIKQWLKQGVGKIVGHPYVDGHHTVELSLFAGSVKKYVIFADIHTYQVVRTIDYFPTLPKAAPIKADYQWIRRSPAMVRRINHPQVPAGFTRVPAGG